MAEVEDVVHRIAAMSGLGARGTRVGGWGSWLLLADPGQGGMSSESQAPPLRTPVYSTSIIQQVGYCLRWLALVVTQNTVQPFVRHSKVWYSCSTTPTSSKTLNAKGPNKVLR